ncbi:MAG: hypothetical protein OXB94_10255 [Nitrospira sp.]|nr:hypothetical protein [Nitrospira sp.]
MNLLKNKCLVDTNVPKTANLATQHDPNSDVSDDCVLACIGAVEHIIRKRGLVIDAGDEIFDEYRQQLSMKGQPGVGDRFMKWVHDHRWNADKVTQIPIVKNGNSYDEFPNHAKLRNFDPSDRKFVAVANAHPGNPPILQATDSKWLGWEKALAKVGITVDFLCRDYVQTKYAKKIGS